MSPSKPEVPIRTRRRPQTQAKEEAELHSSDTEDSVPNSTNDKVDDQGRNGSESDVAQLLRELALVREELAQLKQQSSVPVQPNQPLLSTEKPPTNSRQIQLVDWNVNNSLPLAQVHDDKYQGRSEKTPTIEELSDGRDPTFKQWQASIEDRLSINSDHYRTERERMALVWGHTSGLAKEYLEPQYLSDTDTDRFTTAETMIELLKSYFLTGNEIAESRWSFDCLYMGENESFASFKARFLSAAVKGQVPKSEWFHYLWTRITPGLRVPNLGFKQQWKNSFDDMVAHLTAYNMELAHNE